MPKTKPKRTEINVTLTYVHDKHDAVEAMGAVLSELNSAGLTNLDRLRIDRIDTWTTQEDEDTDE